MLMYHTSEVAMQTPSNQHEIKLKRLCYRMVPQTGKYLMCFQDVQADGNGSVLRVARTKCF